MLSWFVLPNQDVAAEDEAYVPRPEAPPFVKRERLRTDEYLLMPGCDTVGVKQRQGKLEIKALVAGPRPFSQGEVVGRVDEWVKWSFDPSGKKFGDGMTFEQQLEGELDQSGPWRPISKQRCLLKYSFDSGDLIAVSPDLLPDAGCNIELTEIDGGPGAGPWITFGFEAFGRPDRVMAVLYASVKQFFAAHGQPPVDLDGHDSLSYPAWLALLRQAGSRAR